MNNLLIIRGRPASGKTTWLAQTRLIPFVVSPDEIRRKIRDYTYSTLFAWRPEVIWNAVEAELRHRMHNKLFIVLDAQDSDYKRWSELAWSHGYKIWYKEMDTPADVCLERNAKRDDDDRLPDSVMLDAFKWLDEHPIPVPEWQKIPDDIDPFEFFLVYHGELP